MPRPRPTIKLPVSAVAIVPALSGSTQLWRYPSLGHVPTVTSRRLLKYHLLPLLGYSLITAIITFPMALQLTTHIPGEGDPPWFLWQLWWFKRALVDLTQSPLATDLVFFPLQDVATTWQTPYNELIAIPLQAAFSTVLSYNLLILSTFVLSGYCTYLLVLRVTGRADLAFLGGLIFAFSAYRGMRGLHHLSLATTQWMPLALLLLINLWQKPGPRRGLAAGIALGLVALSSPYYLAYFLLPVTLVAAAYVVLWQRHRLRDGALRQAVLVAAIVTGTMAVPFYLTWLLAPSDVLAAARDASASAFVYTADILSWLLPPRDNPLWRNATASIYDKFSDGYLVETTLFFGLVPLLGGLALLFSRRRLPTHAFFWLTLAIVGIIFSFGPVLRLWQQPILPWMPYRLFMLLPGSYAFRVPSRIGITAILALTVLAMLAIKRVMATWPRWPWRGLLILWSILLLASMMVAFPYPSASTAIPDIYEQVAATPGRSAVLELPGGELFLDQMSWYMYYQTYHQKPLVSGYLGRQPDRLFEPERTMPFVRRFFVPDWNGYFAGEGDRLVDWPSAEQILAEGWPEDIRNAPALLANQGIQHVIVHRDPDRQGFFESAGLLLYQGLGTPSQANGDILLFQVPPPQRHIQGDLADLDYANLRFDESFSAPILHQHAVGRSLDLYLSDGGTVTATLPLTGTWQLQGMLVGAGARDAQLAVDDQPVDFDPVQLFDDVYTVQLSADLGAGDHAIHIAGPQVDHPSQDDACSELCIMNLAVRLEKPALDLAALPLARFVDESGLRLDLLDAAVLPPTGGQAGANPRLLTIWSQPATSDRTGWATQLPTLFVHLTDRQGNTSRQADHTLGANSLWTSGNGGSGYLLDVVELPLAELEEDETEVRLGLWYPGRQAYFWALDPDQLDGAARFTAGTVAELLP